MEPNILFNIRKFLAPEIVYGSRSIELVGRHAKNFGASKALVVTDPGVQEAGWAEIVERRLHDIGIKYTTFSDISPNPRDHEIMSGTAGFLENDCDIIIAVGGGSSMDCAKGIGIVATNGGSIIDYEGIDEVAVPVPPLVFIPTTAGSSADVSQFAIINDTARKVKIATISKMVIPDIALVDPMTTVSMSPELTAATGMDALCHAFEAFVSTVSSPLTDMAAISAVRLISENLLGAYQEPENLQFRENMMMASLMAGLAFSNASLGLVHAMAHSLGGSLDLPHGECNAMILEQAVRYNYTAAPGKYNQLAGAMGAQIERSGDNNKDVVADCVSSLRNKLNITQKLSDLGVVTEDLPALAEFAFHDPCLATNPREADKQDIEQIFQKV